MATSTTNYNLRKPADGDFVNVGSDINASMDVIDAELFEHEDRLDDAEAFDIAKTLMVAKTADEAVASSTTPQNDDHLFLALETGSTYFLEFTLFADAGSGTPDLSVDFTYSGTTSLFRMGMMGPEIASGDIGATLARFVSVAAFSSPVSLGLAAGVAVLHFRGTIVTTAAGTFRLRWAQGTSNATATNMRAGSTLKATKLT